MTLTCNTTLFDLDRLVFKVQMRTGELLGVEALVRWQHPQRGLLQPGEFLPRILDSPLIVALGDRIARSFSLPDRPAGVMRSLAHVDAFHHKILTGVIYLID